MSLFNIPKCSCIVYADNGVRDVAMCAPCRGLEALGLTREGLANVERDVNLLKECNEALAVRCEKLKKEGETNRTRWRNAARISNELRAENQALKAAK